MNKEEKIVLVKILEFQIRAGNYDEIIKIINNSSDEDIKQLFCKTLEKVVKEEVKIQTMKIERSLNSR
ncbi:MAG: hypothetical protein IJ743_01070 [Bacilli bacterium]|nr:hypothetical protein [Bacilli bacterium]